jgi:hypothetical protein
MEGVLRAGAKLASAVVGLVLLTVAIALIVLARANGPNPLWLRGGGPGTLTTEQLQAGAATAFEAALAKGGGGITFQVVQRNTLYAKPSGPPIELRSESDQSQVLGTVDAYYVSGIVSTGAITDSAFWMRMRRGPAKDEAPDFAAGELFFSVLERDGVLWRNDGDGWYQTDASPGTGMDPITARKLPGLLRALQAATSLEPTVVDNRLLVGVSGITKVDDYPGVIAADGKDFTDATFEVECWFDDAGRLVQLNARARNLNQTTYDLVSQTVVTFGYGNVGTPPEPTPTMAPQPLPIHEPGDIDVEVQP